MQRSHFALSKRQTFTFPHLNTFESSDVNMCLLDKTLQKIKPPTFQTVKLPSLELLTHQGATQFSKLKSLKAWKLAKVNKSVAQIMV